MHTILYKTGKVLLLMAIGLFLVYGIGTEGSDNFIDINDPFNEIETNTPYEKVMMVITHPRCMNCHPSDNFPKQGNQGKPHSFGIIRGIDNDGAIATQCNTCHQTENDIYSGVPGGPHWELAPLQMGWEGLTTNEIAAAILDKNRNGNRNLEDILDHLTTDPLVLWAWSPGVTVDGVQRTVPPVPLEEYIEAVEAWINQGAPIPD